MTVLILKTRLEEIDQSGRTAQSVMMVTNFARGVVEEKCEVAEKARKLVAVSHLKRLSLISFKDTLHIKF